MSHDNILFSLTHSCMTRLCVCLIALSLVGCASSLAIHHRDPTHKRVSVTIDEEHQGEIDYGDEKTIRVSRGARHVDIVPVGSTMNPWTIDGKGWIIWVDEDAVLTLLPPMPEPRKAEHAERPMNPKNSVDPSPDSEGESQTSPSSTVEDNPYSGNAPSGKE